MLLALLTGLLWGLGNTAFGTITDKGAWASAHTGPFGLAILVIYRLVLMCKVRARKGVWVDKTQSNFYSENGSFNSANLIPLSLVAAISLLCMVIVSNGFNFAKIGEMNQAIVTCLFNVTAIYISVVFYFKFGETIPPIKAFGMLLVILCVVFLCIEGSHKDSEKLVDEALPF